MKLAHLVSTGTLGLLLAGTLSGQQVQRARAVITGRVLDAETGAPVPLVLVTLEGTWLGSVSDSLGHYRIEGVAPGPHVLAARRIGYAPSRVPITVAPTGTVTQDIRLATQALELEGLIVTADPGSRARGELGTASVVEREAIANQIAASVAGVLELVPGVPLAPPGLDNVQQFSLRSVPTSFSPGLTLGGPTAGDLASFGTLIILDGVPLSNNANLQTLGPRGELLLPTSAGGGIDLRRLPASTLDRVEVIRGIPSARYGDLTQGVIVIDTRAAAVEPTLAGRLDPRTAEGTFLAGKEFRAPQALTANFDITNTRTAPGRRRDNTSRVTGQLAHRVSLGSDRSGPAGEGRLTIDTRVDFFQVYENNPEDPEIQPGKASWSRDNGLRISERARLGLDEQTTVEFTGALDYTRRNSFGSSMLVRGAMPFTDRLTEGRAIGKFIAGEFLSQLSLKGEEWQIYSRLEADRPARSLGFDHRVRAGVEFRREWNTGPGYQFDIEFPPQVTFTGVQGFDRPRRFDDVPPVAATALYVDDRVNRTLGAAAGLEVQAGLRLDLLHSGTQWFSGVRDAVLQPRVNAQLAPRPWLRLRGGWGRTAKTPSLAHLFPGLQYFDVVNVNWFAIEPEERLAVLTTFIRDRTNPSLGFSTARKAEAGFELAPARGLAIGLIRFSDRTTGGVGLDSKPDFVLRERFQLSDSTMGTGRPPSIIEPAFAVDTIPILIDRPANNLVLQSRGWELTASFPELRPIRTRLDVQGAWVKTRFFKRGLEFGRGFSQFQQNEQVPRTPFWEDIVRTGERAIFTYRAIHHQPELGLVVTATIQHFAKETRRDVAATDSLAFVGFITRSGELVFLPPEDRAKPEFADLRRARLGAFVDTEVPVDWFMSLQVSKTLPRSGRLSFYAFNALNRIGAFSRTGFGNRFIPAIRFGLDVTIPLGEWISPRD